MGIIIIGLVIPSYLYLAIIFNIPFERKSRENEDSSNIIVDEELIMHNDGSRNQLFYMFPGIT